MMEMNPITYQYAIVGAGCAGMHLALAMLADSYFAGQQILVIEKDTKSINDRTWCFWEEGLGKWDHLIDHAWSRGKFYSSTADKTLNLGGYRYKKLRSIDFYDYAKARILEAPNVHWVRDEITLFTANGKNHLLGKNATYSAEHVFDSRIDPAFFDSKDCFTRILQHFKGWEIETEADFFNPEEFIIMDFRLKYNKSTSFNYVLPTSPRHALIEFTLFTPELIQEREYDRVLEAYLHRILQLPKYSIIEVEKGIIPMSDFPFHNQHEDNLTKIGTAGSWVRPSTGYSFKNSEKYSQQIVANIKAGRRPATGVARNRHRQYDKILLTILKDRNELGEELFTTMFKRNPIQQIFKFLDEDTNLLEDLKIMSSFRAAPFLEALYKRVFTCVS